MCFDWGLEFRPPPLNMPLYHSRINSQCSFKGPTALAFPIIFADRRSHFLGPSVVLARRLRTDIDVSISFELSSIFFSSEAAMAANRVRSTALAPLL